MDCFDPERAAGCLSRARVTRGLEWFARRPCLIILNYHRIGSPDGNEFDDGVFSATPGAFRSQMRYLRENFALPTLEEVVKLHDEGFPLRRPMALVTFDDGYRDNFQVALPILRDLGVQATFFIATGYLEEPCLPWWDHVAYVIKKTRRERFTMDYPRPLTVDLRRCSRQSALKALLRVYKDAEQIRQADFLSELESRGGVKVDARPLGQGLFMSWEELRTMLAAGMSIGSHTHTHQRLASLTDANQEDELVRSKQTLERELETPIVTVAYPIGGRKAFNAVTKNLAKAAGYRLGFTYYGGINRPGHADPFDLRRIAVDMEDLSLLRSRVALQMLFGAFS